MRAGTIAALGRVLRVSTGLAAICLAQAAALALPPDAPAPAGLGALIFRDTTLSASGQMACASCHDPAHAHAPANGVAVQRGGAGLDVPGFRATPSLRYLNLNLPFSFKPDGTPTGGFTRDGGADTLVAQARVPMLAAHEMANGDAATFSARLAASAYADDFRRVFGQDIFADAELTLYAAQYALAQYQQTAREFHPFSAKFDAFLRGELMLSPAELRGFALFNRPDKGNCAACHPSTRQANGAPPVFTDYTYDNLGVPRSSEIPANADPGYFDLGLCARAELAQRRELCGQFKVPTLRNVATRHLFFHNGYFHSLAEALRFYAQRDTNPEKWYPLDVAGVPRKFNDLPPPLARNVNTSEAPYDRRAGEAPALSDAEIDDVVAFLNTLTDGYDPATGTADPARDVPPQG